MKKTTTLDAIDCEALGRAIFMVRRDPDRARQIEDMFSRGWLWESVGKFASYCCQMDSLRLKPWQDPPIFAGGDDEQPEAAALQQRLLDAGLSAFEPDPESALARVEASAR